MNSRIYLRDDFVDIEVCNTRYFNTCRFIEERDEDFKKGKITIAKVKYIDEKDHVQCILQNGLSAALWFGHSFDVDVKDVKDKIKAMFKPGTVSEARVNAIDYTKHKADLIIRPSVMSSHYDFIPNVEVYSNFFELTDEEKLEYLFDNTRELKPDMKDLRLLDSLAIVNEDGVIIDGNTRDKKDEIKPKKEKVVKVKEKKEKVPKKKIKKEIKETKVDEEKQDEIID